MTMELFPAGVRVYLTVLAAVLGLVLGSAFNCLAFRLARGQKWQSGRSVCPLCGHTLGFLDLFPLFSWLFLGGKCRYCRGAVSVRYPLTELTLAVCFTALLWHYGLTLHALVLCILVCCLFCLSLVDRDSFEIPNRFLIIPAVCRIAELLYSGGLRGLWQGVWPGLCLGAFLLLISLLMDKVLKKDSLGGGDIKLLAMLGLFFPIAQCLLLLVLSCIIGLVLAIIGRRPEAEEESGRRPKNEGRRSACGQETVGANCVRPQKDTPVKGKPIPASSSKAEDDIPAKAVPFGPAISIAAFLTLLIGDKLVSWYLGLF